VAQPSEREREREIACVTPAERFEPAGDRLDGEKLPAWAARRDVEVNSEQNDDALELLLFMLLLVLVLVDASLLLGTFLPAI
jgi:hypothetical protein